MLGEIVKRRNDFESAIKYFLRGLRSEPLGNADNYMDMAEVCEIMG